MTLLVGGVLLLASVESHSSTASAGAFGRPQRTLRPRVRRCTASMSPNLLCDWGVPVASVTNPDGLPTIGAPLGEIITDVVGFDVPDLFVPTFGTGPVGKVG